MRPRLTALLIVALVPALVLAAPRKKKKRRKAKPVETVEPAPAPEPTPTPTPEPEGSAAGSAAKQPATPAPQAPAPQTGAGSAAGAGAPPAEPKPAEPEKEAEAVDVDTLRQEYLSLRDELFKSRARANTVASQLYSSRIQIKLTYTSGRFYNPAKASIRLDGASVYENATGAIATDDGIRFEGYIAPGRHVVTFRVEATGKDDDSFTSTTESSVVVKAVPNKDVIVTAKAKDSGDIAYEWKRKERGSYGLGLDVAVKTVAREAKK